jgi:RNA polymerase sigma-70 factor (ECF subfamily)
MLTGFFKVFTHLKDFKHEGSFEGWVRRIMIRESISFLRKKNELDFHEEMDSVKSEGFDTIQAEIDADHIQKLIDELPEGYKAVFVLFAVEGYKHAEIADLLKISVGTSKSQLFKAKKMLQEQIELKTTSSYGN